MRRHRKQGGFTLIEVMVVVVIVAILAAIAYPSYSNYAYRARRADGHEMMMRIASAQVRYYTNLNRYADNLVTLGPGTTSEKGYYTFQVVVANEGQTYTLSAVPTGVQASDKCGTLTITDSGSKGFSGAESNGKCT